ncbi:hypothetical protein AB0J35_60325 [Nonomuraea angiospora]|uniref:hypothetical protein n=1 Tax=Nonomuraea angiospora TaxID=46172 RepID=UPI0034391AB8
MLFLAPFGVRRVQVWSMMRDMAGTGTSWRRLLLAALVVLPVAVAVASNQILNDGVWSLWWIVIAVVLTAASALVTYALTRTATRDTGQAEHPQPSPAADQPLSTAPPVQLPVTPGTQTQLNMPAAGGIVNAVQGGTMNINPPTPPARSPGGSGGSSS